jgi:predicted nucleic acid-binding protein
MISARVWCDAREAFRQVPILGFDLERALRRLKPQKRSQPLTRRPDSELSWAFDEPPIGAPLFLDTSVYLDVLQGRTPVAVDNLLTYRICQHSAVSLAELTHVFGRLDPAHPSTQDVLKTVQETIDDIPPHRLHSPDSEIWGEAGILAGELFRLSGAPNASGHERKYLNDALIYLQAGTLGANVLTANIADFDFLNQLVPNIPIILYRQQAP